MLIQWILNPKVAFSEETWGDSYMKMFRTESLDWNKVIKALTSFATFKDVPKTQEIKAIEMSHASAG